MKKQYIKNQLLKAVCGGLFVCFANVNTYAQSGLTCNDAIPKTSNPTCNFTSYVTTGTEMWFSWTAASTDAQITVISEAFGLNLPHIHEIIMYSGACNNLQAIAEDELSFLAASTELTLDVSGLIIGNTYFFRLQREANGTVECDKGACFPVIQSASFVMCIQEIDVFIPLDFNLNNFGFLESPVKSHIYYTNKGQIVDTDNNPNLDIKLYARNSFPIFYFTGTTSSYVFPNVNSIPSIPDTLQRVDMNLVGANLGVRAFRTEKVPERLNYYLGHIPTGIANVKGYFRTVCNKVYPNIDMQYYSNSEGLKYYFIVHPGGNANDIVMRFDGASTVDVTGSGGLRIETPFGNLEFEAGHAYQINPSGPTTISPMPWQAEFVKVSANEVKFDIRNYPPNKPLIIQVDRGHQLGAAGGQIGNLEHSTYLGGSLEDIAFDVQTDGSGNAYITGYTLSTNFPTQIGTVAQPAFAGDLDAFVSKIDSSGDHLWSTYYGGGTGPISNPGFAEEMGLSLLVSGDGLIYFTGYTTSIDFPTLAALNSYHQNYLGGEKDAFIVALKPDGTLALATYFGGITNEVGHSLAEDNNGNLIICGRVAIEEEFFPFTPFIPADILCEPPKPPFFNGGFPLCAGVAPAYYKDTVSGGEWDAFIAKFDTARIFTWGTVLGGNGDDEALDVIVDTVDNSFYITGSTKSNIAGNNNTTSPCDVPANDGFPLCDLGGSSYYQDTYTGSVFDRNAYIAKFSSQNQLLWNTYIGCNYDIIGHNLKLNSNGDLYLVGRARAFTSIPLPDVFCGVPTNGGFPLCDFGGGAYYRDNANASISREMFIMRFNSNKQMDWSSFIGGSGSEIGFGALEFDRNGVVDIAVDDSNRVYVFGNTEKPSSGPADILVKDNPGLYFEPDNAGSANTRDAYIACFNEINQTLWATHIGGGGTNSGNANEIGTGVAVDNNNLKLYITGGSISPSFPPVCPPSSNPYCRPLTYFPYYDVFFARFSIDFPTTPPPPPTAINDQIASGNSFILYPNPASDNVTLSIELKQKSNISVRLYNAIGQLIVDELLEKQTGRVNYDLNIGDLSTGIYMVQITIGSNKRFTKKIIKN